MLTPSFSKTSDEPEFDDTDLLPCLATLIPQAAAKIAVAVDILRVCFLSPPVPQVSTIIPLALILWHLEMRPLPLFVKGFFY